MPGSSSESAKSHVISESPTRGAFAAIPESEHCVPVQTNVSQVSFCVPLHAGIFRQPSSSVQKVKSSRYCTQDVPQLEERLYQQNFIDPEADRSNQVQDFEHGCVTINTARSDKSP